MPTTKATKYVFAKFGHAMSRFLQRHGIILATNRVLTKSDVAAIDRQNDGRSKKKGVKAGLYSNGFESFILLQPAVIEKLQRDLVENERTRKNALRRLTKLVGKDGYKLDANYKLARLISDNDVEEFAKTNNVKPLKREEFAAIDDNSDEDEDEDDTSRSGPFIENLEDGKFKKLFPKVRRKHVRRLVEEINDFIEAKPKHMTLTSILEIDAWLQKREFGFIAFAGDKLIAQVSAVDNIFVSFDDDSMVAMYLNAVTVNILKYVYGEDELAFTNKFGPNWLQADNNAAYVFKRLNKS